MWAVFFALNDFKHFCENNVRMYYQFQFETIRNYSVYAHIQSRFSAFASLAFGDSRQTIGSTYCDLKCVVVSRVELSDQE